MKRPLPIQLLVAQYGLGIVSALYSWVRYRDLYSGFNGFIGDIVIGWMVVWFLIGSIITYGVWNMREWGRQWSVYTYGLSLGFASLGLMGGGCSAILLRSIHRPYPTTWWPQAVMLGATFVTAGIPFAYLRQPSTRRLFRSKAIDETLPDESSSGRDGWSAKWVVWCISVIVSLIASHFISPDLKGANSSAMKNMDMNGMFSDQMLLLKANDQRTSLAELETKLATISPSQRMALLDAMAKVAYRENQLDKASLYTQDLLSETTQHPTKWFIAQAIHDDHSVLGLLALRKGDVSDAKVQLIDAATLPALNPANRFSPDTALAQALLEKNQRETVIDYFTRCKSLWPDRANEFDRWIATIQHGGIPFFGTEPITG